MAVPKKRKKLADTAETPKRVVRFKPRTTNQELKRRKVVNKRSGKIDEAFEIMDHIDTGEEKIAKSRKGAKPAATDKHPQKKTSSDRLGFRVQVSLDALMPNKQKRYTEKRKQPVKESPVIDINLTIPFLWDLPIVGDMAQKIFKNFKTIKF